MTNNVNTGDTLTGAREQPEYEFQFREWHFYWLAKVDRAYNSALAIALQRHGLDIPGWRVLMILHARQQASVSELADHSITKLSTMTKIVQRMQNDGLVESRPNPEDRRVTMVHITCQGDLMGKKAWQEARRISANAFTGFSVKEMDTLNKLLRRMGKNLAER